MTMLVDPLIIGFAGALFAFAHCLGMCGGFVLCLSPEKKWSHQLLWHTGRLSTYLFLGSLAGFAGRYLAGALTGHAELQRLITYLAGGFMAVMGVSLMGLLPVRQGLADGVTKHLLRKWSGELFAAPSPATALMLGITTALLPCPVLLAVLAYGVQSGSVPTAMAALGGMGLGTLIPLLLLGAAARLATLPFRRWSPRVGGALLILLGITTVLRGTEIFHRMLGCPHLANLQQDTHHPGMGTSHDSGH